MIFCVGFSKFSSVALVEGTEMGLGTPQVSGCSMCRKPYLKGFSVIIFEKNCWWRMFSGL